MKNNVSNGVTGPEISVDIRNCDCLNLMQSLPNNSIDLVITDPPYGVNFSKGFDDSIDHVSSVIDDWMGEIYRVMKDGSHCYIFVPVKEIDLWVGAVKRAGFTFMNLLATKTYTTNSCFKNNFTYTHQPVIYCSKGTAKPLNEVNFIRTSESWFKDKRNKNPQEFTYQYPAFLPFFSNEKSNGKRSNSKGRHPCAKNISFLKTLIELSSQPGELVLDPFVGGGSTPLACIETHRNFIGSELSEEYFEATQNTINEALAKAV